MGSSGGVRTRISGRAVALLAFALLASVLNPIVSPAGALNNDVVIEGEVRAPWGGPLANTEVSVERRSANGASEAWMRMWGWSASTDSQGHFTITRFAGDPAITSEHDYRLRVEPTDDRLRPFFVFELSRVAGGFAPVSLDAVEPNLTVYAQTSTGAPLVGAMVWLSLPTTEADDLYPSGLDDLDSRLTDAAGMVRLYAGATSPPGQPWQIEVNPGPGDDADRIVHRFTVDAAGVFDHGSASATQDASGSTLTLRVTNLTVRIAAGHGPAAGATVQLQRLEPSQPDATLQRSWVDVGTPAQTGLDGIAKLWVEPPGQGVAAYRLRVRLTADAPPVEFSHSFDLDAQGNFNHGFADVSSRGVLELNAAPNTQLRVYLDGAPPTDSPFVSGANITLQQAAQPGHRVPAWQHLGDSVANRHDGQELTLTLPVPSDGSLSFRLLVELRSMPTFAHRFTVHSDGSIEHDLHDRTLTAAGELLHLNVAGTYRPAGQAEPAWLTAINAARANAGLHPLVERLDWNHAARQHACYATANTAFEHNENPQLPWHTPQGLWATSTGNLLWASSVRTPTQAVHRWLNSPGHGAWMLDSAITEVGYGAHYDRAREQPFTAVLPIIGSRTPWPSLPAPYTYPADDRTIVVTPPSSADLGASHLETLHLYHPGLHDGAADASATITINGRETPINRIEVRPHVPHLAVVLHEPVPPGAHVDAQVHVNNTLLHRWSFRTTARTGPPVIEADIMRDPYLPVDAAGSIHHASISAVIRHDIASGYPDGTFRPNQPVTRGQLASFLARGLDLPPATTAHGLTDITGTTHEQAIAALVASGITSGYPDGTFRPDQPVTRGQFAAFLARGLDLTAPSSTTPPSDVAGTTHERAIAAVIHHNIASGYPDGTFQPSANVSRAQLATFLNRALTLPC